MRPSNSYGRPARSSGTSKRHEHVEDDLVVGEIKGFAIDELYRLTDNLLHLMKNIVALGDEPEQMMWWGEVSVPNFVPYAVIKDVGITKSAE